MYLKHVSDRLTARNLAMTVGILAVLLVAYQRFRTRSADDVAQMTTRALETGNVDTLLQLAWPEEIDKLNLNRANVRQILNETVYTGGLPGPLRVTLMQSNPIDQPEYYILSADGHSHGLNFPHAFAVNMEPDGRWYLPLGDLLLGLCAIREPDATTGEIRDKFWRLAIKNGIRGKRLNTTGYIWVPEEYLSGGETNGTPK